MQILKLDSILRQVLSIGNKEQNQHYPPSIYTQHINYVTNVMINEIAQNYPRTQDYIDLITPFIETDVVPVINGEAKLPNNYRRLLGIGAFFVSVDGNMIPSNENGECAAEFDGDPLAKSQAKKDAEQKKASCVSKEVDILSVGEWNNRSNHSFKQPTLDRPIACQFGHGKIKICPYNAGSVEIRYVRNPKEYIYGYVELPDGTYQFDASKSVESEWGINATEYIVNAVSTVFSVYTRDGEMEKGLAGIKQLLF